MTFSDHERREASGHSGDPRTYVRTIKPTAIKFGMVTHVGRGAFVRGQARSQSRGAGHQRAPIGVPLNMPTPRTTIFGVVTHIGMDVLFGERQ